MRRLIATLLLFGLPALAEPPEWQQEAPSSSAPTITLWQKLNDDTPAVNEVVWSSVPYPSGTPSQVVWMPVGSDQQSGLTASETPSIVRPLTNPPELQAFNRSIAFGDGVVGPDISWRVPNGLIWTPHHWIDATASGFSRNKPGENFWNWNGGDATANLFINLINSKRWSFGLSQSIRSVSVISNSSVPGGSTPFGQGQSTGFRLGYALSPTSGVALGGEQVIQWDSYTDTGRTFYLALTKGWWLGQGTDPYPLLIGNASLASGRFAKDRASKFGCTDTGANRTDSYRIDNNLCWGPIGSLALVLSPELSLFTEYSSVRWAFGTSLAPIPEVPFRATWAVNVLSKIPEGNDLNRTTWSFRLSLGF